MLHTAKLGDRWQSKQLLPLPCKALAGIATSCQDASSCPQSLVCAAGDKMVLGLTSVALEATPFTLHAVT